MLMPMLWRNDLDDIMDPFDMWDREADSFFGNDLMHFDTMLSRKTMITNLRPISPDLTKKISVSTLKAAYLL